MMLKHIKNCMLTATLLAMTLPVAAEPNLPIPNNLQAGWDTITQNQIQADIQYLTADSLEGRLALTTGDAKTIDWLVAQFKKIGLKPANDGSYLQTFNLIQFTPDEKYNTLSLEKNGKTIAWKKPDIIAEFNHDLHLSAPVVFAGYGITAPTLHYDDYKDLDVKGKFVLVFEHEPQETDAKSIFNGTGNTPYATNRVKVLNAQAHGAIGILVAPEPNRLHPSNLQRQLRIGDAKLRKTPLPSMVLENDAVQIPIVTLSDKIATEIAAPLNLGKLQKAIDKDLTPQSRDIPNGVIALQERVTSRTIKPTSNVVGFLEGADPHLKSETIIISAHHDHNGKSGKNIWHGADDNASGTAGVLIVANAMITNSNVANGLKPKRSILFAIFGAEERGLLGSYYMAAHPLRPLDTTRAVINFDMIGRDEKPSEQTKGLIKIPTETQNRLNLIGGHFSPDYDKVVRDENQYIGLSLDNRFDTENALNSFFRSDQFPFVLQHIPAFGWNTGFHPDYHFPSDTADKIDYPKMQKILRLAYLSAYQFANIVVPPLFVVDPKPSNNS